MLRDALRSSISLLFLVATLLTAVAFFYSCRSGGTDHTREAEYDDLGAVPTAPAPSLHAPTHPSSPAKARSLPTTT